MRPDGNEAGPQLQSNFALVPMRMETNHEDPDPAQDASLLGRRHF